MLQQLGFSGTQTQIADTGNITPWDQAQGLPYTDEDDAFDNDYYKGPPPDLDDDSDFDPDSFEYAQAGPGYRPRPGSDAGGGAYGGGQAVPMGSPAPKMKYDPHMKMMVPNIPRASKGKNTMVAHYEPQGEVIAEKKKLKSVKDIAKKIPGYYDGKPSPTGFPMEPPPKLVKHMHPELTSGDRAAKRFNKLDPASAKAMPKTAYPHIDKKVQTAAKKPK